MFIFPTPESPPIHPNKWVDAMTRTHYLLVPAMFLPLTAATWAYGVLRLGAHPGWSVLVAILGFFAWTFAEYGLHRTMFHWEHDSAFGRKFHFTVHGVHHELPNDPYRLVMPPWVNVPLYTLVGLGFTAIAPVYGWPFLAGFGLGYMVYDVTHYYIHHQKKLATNFHKKLKAHHMNHHYNGTKKFGVSFMIWDRVFGSM